MNKVKVAVYGSLRKGLGNHTFLENAEYIGDDRVSGWDMYSYGAYPYITHGDGEITVEVYEVDKETLLGSLDMLEGYPNFYDREEIETKYGKAWIYFIDNEVNAYPQVYEGDWKDYYNERHYELGY